MAGPSMREEGGSDRTGGVVRALRLCLGKDDGRVVMMAQRDFGLGGSERRAGERGAPQVESLPEEAEEEEKEEERWTMVVDGRGDGC